MSEMEFAKIQLISEISFTREHIVQRLTLMQTKVNNILEVLDNDIDTRLPSVGLFQGDGDYIDSLCMKLDALERALKFVEMEER